VIETGDLDSYFEPDTLKKVDEINVIFDEKNFISESRHTECMSPSNFLQLQHDEQTNFEESVMLEASKFPMLSDEMYTRIQLVLSSGSENSIIIEKFGLRILKKDLRTLQNLNWLNDEVINFYMRLLSNRSLDDTDLIVYAMDTFFTPNYCLVAMQASKGGQGKLICSART